MYLSEIINQESDCQKEHYKLPFLHADSKGSSSTNTTTETSQISNCSLFPQYFNLLCHRVSEMEQKWYSEILWYAVSALCELGHFLKSRERTEGSWKPLLLSCSHSALGQRVMIFFAFSFEPTCLEKKNIWELTGSGTVKQSTSTPHRQIKFQTVSYIRKHLIDG